MAALSYRVTGQKCYLKLNKRSNHPQQLKSMAVNTKNHGVFYNYSLAMLVLCLTNGVVFD